MYHATVICMEICTTALMKTALHVVMVFVNIRNNGTLKLTPVYWNIDQVTRLIGDDHMVIRLVGGKELYMGGG